MAPRERNNPRSCTPGSPPRMRSLAGKQSGQEDDSADFVAAGLGVTAADRVVTAADLGMMAVGLVVTAVGNSSAA